jgi:sugar-phosphatase
VELRVDGVLLDSDGVLVDSGAAVEAAWLAWARHFEVDPAGVLRVNHGRPAVDVIALVAPHLDLGAAFALVEQLEVDTAHQTRPMPGAVDLVRSLPRDRWAVVTSATRRLATARLAASGIHPRTVVTAEDTTHGKPHPAPYLAAAERLGLDPNRCVVFDDTPLGLAAGRAAGATVVGVASLLSAEELEADAVVGGLDDVRADLDGSRIVLRLA